MRRSGFVMPARPNGTARMAMNILFVTANRIGDAVLSTGLLAHLLARHPQAACTVVCGPAAAPLFANAPGVVRVLPLAKRRHRRHWLDLWRACAATRWELVVDLRGSLLAWTLSARERRVFRPTRAPEHRVVQLARLLGLAETPPAPKVWIGPAEAAQARTLLPTGGEILALGPTANWPAKQWPATRFAALAERLTGADGPLAGAAVLLLGGPGEREMAAPLCAALPPQRRIDLVGRADLPLAAACLARASLFVGNDSGLMHLAAASGVPTLGLFGPSPEVHYAPWGAHAVSLRGRRSYEEIVGAPGFDPRASACLMEDLEVAAVAEAAATLWRRTQSQGAAAEMAPP